MKINYYIDDIEEDIKTISNFNESLALGLGLTGVFSAGVLLSSLYKSYRLKLNSCKSIDDPILNDKCQIGVLNNMILNLKSQIDSCNSAMNPTECKLKLINEIEKLEDRKMLYMRNMYRLKKVKKEEGD